MKKLFGVLLVMSSLIVGAQDDPRFPKYSKPEDLVFSDTFLLTKHRLYPTGIEWAIGKQYIQEGSRWIDIGGEMEIVSTTAGSEGLLDYWEVHKITGYPDKNRIVFKIRYLTIRWPYNFRAGKLGMIVMELNSKKQIETISFSIADNGYSGPSDTFYIYRFMQDVPAFKYDEHVQYPSFY